MLSFWSKGHPAALDVTVVHPLQEKLISGGSTKSYFAAKQAEEKKVAKYSQACSKAKVTLLPLAVEFFGGWGPTAQKFFRKLATAIGNRSERKPNVIIPEIYQKLSSVLVKANAAALALRCDW